MFLKKQAFISQHDFIERKTTQHSKTFLWLRVLSKFSHSKLFLGKLSEDCFVKILNEHKIWFWHKTDVKTTN